MPYTAGPFDSAHLLLQWGGKLAGDEEWSCSLRMRKVGGGSAAGGDAEPMMAGVTAAVSAYHTDDGTQIYYGAKLSFVKLNAIATTGKYMLQSTNQTVVADLPGYSSSGNYPNQVALAVSLETGFSRGPAHAGRFYLPTPGISITAGLIGASNAQQVADSTDQFLAALALVNLSYEPAIFSRKSGAAGNRRITYSRVGRVLDTQRKRRRSLIEDYALAA